MAERRRRRSKAKEKETGSAMAVLTDSMKVQDIIARVDRDVMENPKRYPGFHQRQSSDARRSYMSGVFKVAAEKTRHHPAELVSAWDRRFNQPPPPKAPPILEEPPKRKKRRRRPKRSD